MRKAISYLRFSDALQASGDSRRRQSDEATRYAADAGLQIVDTFEDLGVSAFRGANKQRGALKSLIHMAESGALQALGIHDVIIEGFDRLSRMEVDEAYDLFRDLMRAGLTIHTTKDRRAYDRKSLKDPMYLMGSIMIMARANEESAMKSYRLTQRREQNRVEARNGTRQMTRVCPAWLEWDDSFERNGKRGWFKPIPERVEVIRTMYELSAAGSTIYSIARHLTDKRVAPFGSAKQGWSTTYISKALQNEAVLGTMQPCKLQDGKYLPVGDPILDYYPAIISTDLYARAQAGKTPRNTSKGRTGKHFTNLFKGLLYCDCCSNADEVVTMQIRPSIRRGKTYNYLLCSGKRKTDKHPTRQNFSYDKFERAVLTHLRDLDLSPVINLDAESEALRVAVTDLEYRLKGLQTEQETLARQLDRVTDDRLADFVMARLSAKLTEIAETEAKLTDARDANKRHDFKLIQRSQSLSVIEALKAEIAHASPDELYGLRERLSITLRSVVDHVWFDPLTGYVTVIVLGGLRAYRIKDGYLDKVMDLVPSVRSGHIPLDALPLTDRRRKLAQAIVD